MAREKSLLVFAAFIFGLALYGTGPKSELVQETNTLSIYQGHSGSVNSVVFKPNSTIFYSASSDGTVLQWGLNDNSKTPRTIFKNQVINNLIAISSDGRCLAVATEGDGIHLLNPARMFPSASIVHHGNNRIVAMDFDPDDEHLFFADSDNNIMRYNIRNGNMLLVSEFNIEILSLSVSPGGGIIAAGLRGGSIVLINKEGQLVMNIADPDGGDILTVQFNSDGSRLASGNLRGDLKLWEVPSGKLINVYSGHTSRIADVKFSPDDHKIASASFDGTIRIWSSKDTSTRPLILKEHDSWVRTIDFNTGGDRLVSGSWQGNRLITWDLN